MVDEVSIFLRRCDGFHEVVEWLGADEVEATNEVRYNHVHLQGRWVFEVSFFRKLFSPE